VHSQRIAAEKVEGAFKITESTFGVLLCVYYNGGLTFREQDKENGQC
jgi:hypothetical protein